MKISEIIKRQEPEQGFPMIGVDGYGGEQDGQRVMLSEVLRFESRAAADMQYPDIPGVMKLHWGRYDPGRGWTVVVGCWSDQGDEEMFVAFRKYRR